MTRTCPACKSKNARRSAIRAAEITWRHVFLSPYRCRECRTRFWVLSRNFYTSVSVVVVAIVIGATSWHVLDWLSPTRGASPPAATDNARIAELVKRAEGSDAVAELELSHLLGSQEQSPRSAKDEYMWLVRSAGHGNLQAQYELGLALRDGRGTIQDYEAARTWIQRAAEGGIGDAQLELGVIYRMGRGVAVDNLKAYAWLNVAAAQGVPGATAARDNVLGRLSPAELLEAQAEARRMSEIYIPKADPAR
jgi:hypothetical protein